MEPPRINTRKRALAFGAGAVLLIALSGCATTVPPRPGSSARYTQELEPFDTMPRARMGCLPFPGPFTLYDTADPTALGDHSYSGRTEPGNTHEVDRGIVYTRRAGFIDICHVRNAADMTAYLHARVRLAIDRGWDTVRFRSYEPSDYLATLHYPEGWDAMDPGERERVAEELSVRVAQQLAFEVMTWHEILTWYGYKSTIVFSEHGSAFTYEDTTSHMLGIELAGRALRSGADYNARMTLALNNAMDELQAVDHDGLNAALDAVKDDWWSPITGPKKRNLDIGEGDGAIEPWLVPGVDPGEGAITFRLPGFDNVAGHDLTGFCTVEIDPNVLEGFKIRDRLAGAPDRVVPERDFPVLIDDIAGKLGEAAAAPPTATRPEHAVASRP